MTSVYQRQQIGATVRQGITLQQPFGQICDTLDSSFGGTFYWRQEAEEVVIYQENGSGRDLEVWRGRAHP